MPEKNEIELKLVADRTIAGAVLSAADESAVVTTSQRDEYYSPIGGDYMAEEFPYRWLRVREFDGGAQVCFKHFYPEGAENHEYCDEIELNVDDADGLRRLFLELGFESVVEVEKVRRSFRHGGDVEVSVDDVKGLGTYVEVEYLGDSADIEEAHARVEEAVRELGLDGCPIDRRGYPYRLYRIAADLGIPGPCRQRTAPAQGNEAAL